MPAELNFETLQVLASMIAGFAHNRPLTAKCRFDPTVQNLPPDVKCRVFRSGIRSVEPQPTGLGYRAFRVRTDCRSELPEGVDGQERRKEWTSIGMDGDQWGHSGIRWAPGFAMTP